MRFKQKVLLFLTSIMLTATVGMINPMEVKAEQSPQSYTKENGGILSVDNLGPATEWTYNETVYEVYNGFIPFTSNSSWKDASGFVKVLNDANYDGHNDWQLLDSVDMALAWRSDFPDILRKGGIEFLWTADITRYWRYAVTGYGSIRKFDKTITGYSNLGFVVLRGASEPGANEEPDNLASETEAAASENEIEDAEDVADEAQGGEETENLASETAAPDDESGIEDTEDVEDEAQGGEETENLASETAAPDDESEIEDASLTGSVLSGGSLWIIIGVALAAVIAVIALVLAKKKQGK